MGLIIMQKILAGVRYEVVSLDIWSKRYFIFLCLLLRQVDDRNHTAIIVLDIEDNKGLMT